jgi:phage terminase large subunit
VVPDNDSELIILTYKDNEGLPQTIVDDIESKRDKALTSDYWSNWWKVYGLGEIGNLQGAVFENWKQIDKLPNDARLLGYGMDFGFTNDPSTLIACYKYNDQIIWDEVIYGKGLLNSDIVNIMKSKEVSGTIWADSAEPKSIAEIRANGFYIKPTDKGKDSIIYGIGVMQEMDMLVTSRSVNTIKELRGYTWDKDKTGATLNKPIDAMNHSIDAMRYFSMMQFGKKSQGIYHVY